MSVVKWKRTQPRLATLVKEAGGVSVGAALAAVPAHLEPLREDCLAAVDAHITTLEQLVAAGGEGGDLPRALDAVYTAAGGVLDAAGPFDLEDVCKAAWSLCELADRSRRAGRCDWRAVAVHVQALRLLRGLPAGERAARDKVLEGLARLLERTQAV